MKETRLVEKGDDFLIRASEVGQYVYCARAWWLARLKGQRSKNVAELAVGQTVHHRHSRAVLGYRRWEGLARLLWGLAAAVGLILLGLILMGRW